MTPEQKGLPYASEKLAFGLGGAHVPKTDFLAASRKMAAPEIMEVVIRLNGSVTAGGGGQALGIDAAKLVKQVQITDDEDLVKLTGASVRVVDWMNFGARHRDPANVGTGATSASYVFELRYSFECASNDNPGDTRLPVSNLLDGGQVQVFFADALPTNWSTCSLSSRVWARVVDARKKRIKSRRKVTELNYNNDDATYNVNGAIRALILSSNLTTTGYTDLSGITALNSNNLDWYQDTPTSLLLDEYRHGGGSPIDETNDPFVLAHALALVTPDKYQRIQDSILIDSAHLKLGATPASATLIMDRYVARPPNATAKSMNLSVDAYLQAVLTQGVVIGSDGSKVSARELPDALARILPLDISGTVSPTQ